MRRCIILFGVSTGSSVMDPCMRLHEDSFCTGDDGICRGLMFVNPSSFLYDSFGLDMFDPSPHWVKCSEAPNISLSAKYAFNLTLFEAAYRELTEKLTESVIPVVRRFPLSLDQLDLILSDLVPSCVDVERTFAWKSVMLSNEFNIFSNLVAALDRILLHLPKSERYALHEAVNRMVYIVRPGTAMPLIPIPEALALLHESVDQSLRIAQIIEQIALIDRRSFRLVYLEVLDCVVKAISIEADSAVALLLRDRFEANICPLSVDVLILMLKKTDSVNIELFTKLVLLCASHLTVSAQAYFSWKLAAKLRPTPAARIVETLRITKSDPLQESLAYLSDLEGTSSDVSLPLIVTSGNGFVGIDEWMNSVKSICFNSNILTGTEKLELAPLTCAEQARAFRACGRLIGLALRENGKLTNRIPIDVSVFRLLKIMSPRSSETGSEPTVGQLEAARFLREGIADATGVLMIHSMNEVAFSALFLQP